MTEQALRAAMAELETANARIIELEAALRRFAEVRWAEDVPDNYGITIAQRAVRKKTSLKVADFRRAAKALRK